MKEKLISLAEWAKLNGITPRHARRLAKSGKIPTKKMAIYILGVDSEFRIKK